MLIDEITLNLEAGRGGDGVTRFLHEKNKEFSGPSGGDGGKGGDVYFEAVSNVWILTDYTGDKKFKAERGGDGGSNNKTGGSGQDLIIKVPVGSHITNLDSGREYDLTKIGERTLVLFGGLPGKGNKHFKSFTEPKPEKHTDGRAGEKGNFKIELRLIADIGLVGLPNAGKSSLLNALTNSHAKIGDYKFTTLGPNLGNLFGYIIADIPGLIEGASEGKGLGHKFLKHIKRTRILAHCISMESDNLERDYEIIRNELQNFDSDLISKKEIIILTKNDVINNKKEIKNKEKTFKDKGFNVYSTSIIDDESIKKIGENLIKEVKTEIGNP